MRVNWLTVATSILVAAAAVQYARQGQWSLFVAFMGATVTYAALSVT